jgi:hypothetical protein
VMLDLVTLDCLVTLCVNANSFRSFFDLIPAIVRAQDSWSGNAGGARLPRGRQSQPQPATSPGKHARGC